MYTADTNELMATTVASFMREASLEMGTDYVYAIPSRLPTCSSFQFSFSYKLGNRMKQIIPKLLAGFIVLSFYYSVSFAQQDEEAEAEENSGGILERYGSNAASLLDSATADANSIPLLRDYSSVTDEVLQNPPDSDWVTWRRTYDNLGFSNLDQINRQSVADLKLAWTQEVTAGNNMPTPLVHDGIMFL
jgi:hypothetical protein